MCERKTLFVCHELPYVRRKDGFEDRDATQQAVAVTLPTKPCIDCTVGVFFISLHCVFYANWTRLINMTRLIGHQAASITTPLI